MFVDYNIPKGKEQGMPIWDLSRSEEDREALIKKNAEFKIIRIERKEENYYARRYAISYELSKKELKIWVEAISGF